MRIRLRTFWELFVHNGRLKLLALLLAIFTYYAIRGAIGFEIQYVVPVEVQVEPGIAILEQNPRTVRVWFRGSKDDLRQLDQNEMRAVVRPKAISPAGTETVPVRERDVIGAHKVRVVKVQPPAVTLTFDREAQKVVSVIRPKTIGRPLVGRVELEYEPREVVIRGPRRRLQDKLAVSTEPVDVEGRVESFAKQVRVLPPADTWVSHIDPEEITVRVKILTESVSRTWARLPVQVLWHAATTSTVAFKPTAVDLTLEGRAGVLDEIPSNGVSVYVEGPRLLPPSTGSVPVRVVAPVGIDVTAEVRPEAVVPLLPPAPGAED